MALWMSWVNHRIGCWQGGLDLMVVRHNDIDASLHGPLDGFKTSDTVITG